MSINPRVCESVFACIHHCTPTNPGNHVRCDKVAICMLMDREEYKRSLQSKAENNGRTLSLKVCIFK